MDRGKWIIVLVLILLAASASAEIFKYVDKDGNVKYTDDLSVVPKEQRPGIEIVGGTEDKADIEVKDAEPQQEQTEITETEGPEEIRARLEKQQQELDQEFKALNQEIEALKKEKEAFMSSRRYKSGPDSIVTRQLKELNAKIAASMQKLKDFNKKKAVYEVEMKTMQGE